MNNKLLVSASSFLIPGLGQILNGQVKKGIFMMLLMLLPTWGILNCYSAYDAWKNARLGKFTPTPSLPSLPAIPWNRIVPAFLAVLVASAVYVLLFFLGLLYFSSSSPASEQAAQKEMAEISKAIAQWHVEKGVYPSRIEDLLEGRPLRKNWLKDSWGSAYELDADSVSYRLKSPGPDKRFGTIDDILTHGE